MSSFVSRFLKSRFFSWTLGAAVIAAVLWLGRAAPLSGVGTGVERIPDDGKLHVVFFDVGQGDAALVRTPSGDDILIDGGPGGDLIEKLGAVLPAGDRDIELLILTHPHADHVTGLVEALRRYEIRRALVTGVAHTTDTYLSFLRELGDRKIPAETAVAGKSIRFGETGLDLLWPEEDLSGKSVPETAPGEGGGLNDTSIVFRLVYRGTEILFTGDATSAVEERLVASASSTLSADLLKVGHHGSQYSTSRAFLEAVRPRFAVISAGAGNRYGHPAYRILKRLRDAGALIFRTDLDGDILAESDGAELKIRSERGELASEPAF